MKKFRTLVGVMVASSILVGAGYAGWSEQVTLATTVETGTFCVQINGAKEMSQISNAGDVKFKVLDLNKHNETNGEQKAKLKIENLYPGTEMIYKVEFKNLGSVDAIMESFQANIGEQVDGELLKYLEVSVSDSEGDEDWHKVNMLAKDIKILEETFDIEKGGKKDIFIKVEMNKDIDSGFNHHIAHQIDLELGFNWIQSNLVPKQESGANQNN